MTRPTRIKGVAVSVGVGVGPGVVECSSGSGAHGTGDDTFRVYGTSRTQMNGCTPDPGSIRSSCAYLRAPRPR